MLLSFLEKAELAHHLGVDVHDFCDDDAPLAPGMALAVELGVYLPRRGGVRLETNVKIVEDGARELL